jgi:Siphovirus-type tail component, C-terminal domain
VSDAPWIPDTDCETHEWRSAGGETIRFVTRTEAQQRMMPPVSITTIRVPQAQGGQFRGARHEMRLVTLPVVVPGPTAGRDELRRWARALDPLKGEGTLTVVQGDHAGRQLVCAYEAGLDEFSEEWPLLGLTTIGFRAADPYWQDSSESSTTARIGAAFSWFPFAGSWAQQPLVLGAANIFAALTVDNVGDVDAWPVITAVGPGSDLTVRNDSTGETTHLTGAVAAASTVVIDTRPGHKTVTVDGFNAFGRLDSTSSLWPLIAGPNRISITFANATTAASVAFAWRNRWLAA